MYINLWYKTLDVHIETLKMERNRDPTWQVVSNGDFCFFTTRRFFAVEDLSVTNKKRNNSSKELIPNMQQKCCADN